MKARWSKRGRLSAMQIDRILDGDLNASDERFGPLASLVDEIRVAYSVDVAPDVRKKHLRAMSSSFEPAPWARKVRRVRFGTPRIGLVPRAAVAALGLAVASGTALAATGNIPAPIANVAKRVGLNVGGANDPTPAAISDGEPKASASGSSVDVKGEEEGVAPPAATVLADLSNPGVDLDAFLGGRAMDHLRAFAEDIGPRSAESAGETLAADYISRQISKLGWRVERRAFPLPQGGHSYNVVGTPPGFRETSRYLIVGAHYDSIGPGANANASGLGALVEIARALDVRAATLPVMIVAFGAGEQQPTLGSPAEIGSRWFVNEMTEEARSNLEAFVNLDEVGLDDPVACARLSTRRTEATRQCLAVAEVAGIPAYERITPSWSDNGSFQVKGLNAVWLWTGLDECCTHTERDTVEHVHPEAVDRAGRLALAMLRSYQ